MYNDGDTSDDDLSDDAPVEAYRILYLKWNYESNADGKKNEIIEAILQEKNHLMLTISELKEEVNHLTFKLECMTKFVQVLNSGTETLEEIIGVGIDMAIYPYSMSTCKKYSLWIG